MDVLDDVHAAFVLQRVREHLAEGFTLRTRGHGRLQVEHGGDKLLIAAVRVLCVIQRAVEVRRAVVKGREQEADLRRGGDPVRAALVEFPLCGVIAQDGLRLLHGADAAEYIGKLLLAALVLPETVARTERHVIAVRSQQDQVVVRQMQRACDLFIQGLHGLLVLQAGVAQPHEQAVLVAVRDLRRREAQVGEGFAHSAGDAFFQQLQIFFLLTLRKQAHGKGEGGDELAVDIDIAAVDFRDIAPILAITAAELRVDHVGYLSNWIPEYYSTDRCTFPARKARKAKQTFARNNGEGRGPLRCAVFSFPFRKRALCSA